MTTVEFTNFLSEAVQNLVAHTIDGSIHFVAMDWRHIVRLLAPMLERENHTKDIDFSASGIRQRWEAGYAHTKDVLEQRPWEGDFDPLAGVVLHEREEGLLMAAE